MNVGSEVTFARAVVANLGHGKQTYQPGSVYGVVVERDVNGWRVRVQWYMHHASTWHDSVYLRSTQPTRLLAAL